METEKKGKKKKILIIVVVLLLLAVIAVLGLIIYKLLNKEEETRSRLPSKGLIVDEQEPTPDIGLFTTDMNMIWTFPEGELTSEDAVIGNSSENKYDTYFEVYLEDDEETLLYSSPIIPVGKRLDKLKLDKGLPAGQYEALCTFHLLDSEEKEVGDVSFYVTLVFK